MSCTLQFAIEIVIYFNVKELNINIFLTFFFVAQIGQLYLDIS